MGDENHDAGQGFACAAGVCMIIQAGQRIGGTILGKSLRHSSTALGIEAEKYSGGDRGALKKGVWGQKGTIFIVFAKIPRQRIGSLLPLQLDQTRVQLIIYP